MGFPVGQPIEISYYHGASGVTINARVIDEAGAVFGAELTLVENAAMVAVGRPGWYKSTFTPDAEGDWKVAIYYLGVLYGQIFYRVGDTVDVMAHKGVIDAGAPGSTTVHPCIGLAGFGDDFFNTDWVMVVILNANAVGVAPEGQIRDITDYVSATGTFTTVAFGANVEEADTVFVARREFFTVDGVALQATPTVNSLGYRISQYIATGDGDWVGGTPLPSNESLYDQHLVPTVDLVTNLIMSQVLGGKADTAAAAINATNSLMRYMKGALGAGWTAESLFAIYNLIDAILDLTETGGTLGATGGEDTIYLNNAPANVFEPRHVLINLTNMAGVDSVTIRIYYRIRPAAALVLQYQQVYTGPQTVDLWENALIPNRYGYEVTLEQTAGVNRNYDWEVLYEG